MHGCAEAVQAGFCTPEEIAAMVDREFADRVNRVSYSQANTGLVVQGMAKAGLYDDALVTLEDQWGAALRYGGTTTFEMFHPSAADVLGPNDPPPNGQCGMTSLCHPWGAGVCQYLNEVVAGIVPTSPGFATVDILPHLGRRLTSASAVTPTPHGPVIASVDVEAGTGRVVLPAGVHGRIGIPKVERRITRITVNGRTAWDGTFHPVPGIAGATEDAEFVIFEGVDRRHLRVPGRAPGSPPPRSARPRPTRSAASGKTGSREGPGAAGTAATGTSSPATTGWAKTFVSCPRG